MRKAENKKFRAKDIADLPNIEIKALSGNSLLSDRRTTVAFAAWLGLFWVAFLI
jgi:hypothetical protein